MNCASQMDLPSGWHRCALPNFTRIVMGQSPSSETYNLSGLGIPFFQGKGEFGRVYPKIRLYCSQPKKIAKQGATLLSVRAPVGPTNLAQQECCIGRGLAAIHPCGGIAPEFVLYMFRNVESQLSREGTGSTFGAISRRAVESMEFDLPPLSEQKRILAKIDELFSELDQGIESLKKARAQLETYRQAVLKHAFEGKLTVQWRDQNKDSIEKPEQLIARIKQRRAAQFEQQILAWKTALREWHQGGKNDGKPRNPKHPPTVGDISDDVLSTLPTLADSWIWGKLGLMTCGVEYGTSAKSSASGDVPVLRMGNIQDANLDWSDLAYTSNHDEIRRYSLKDGDVLFNRTNSPELVGKTALYRGERPAIFAGYLIRINHMESVVDGQYVNLFLNSRVARQYGNSVKTDGVNQSNINGAKLVEYPFPYCSIEEQREATTILDRTLSHLEEMDEVVPENWTGG